MGRMFFFFTFSPLPRLRLQRRLTSLKRSNFEISFSRVPKGTKINLKNWIVREIRGKITMLDLEERTSFGLSYREV